MTIEEIKSEVEKTPALKTALLSSFKDEFIKGSEAEGIIVRTKDEDKQYLDNHVKTVVDAKVAESLKSRVGEEFGKAMDGIDAEIKNITGVEKNNGEKTTAYAKRALDSIKSKGGDPVTKARVEELEKMLDSTKTDYEKKLSDLEIKTFNQTIDFAVNSELDKRTIALPAHLKTDKEKQEYIAEEKDMLKRSFLAKYAPKKDNDGNIVFYEGETPLMNKKDGKPMAAGDILGEKYAHRFVPATHQQSGTGTGIQGGAGSGFKSTDDIHKHLAAQGIEAGTESYMNQYTQLAAENKISI